MIRICREDQLEAILEVVNDGARAYRGIIPPDRWKEPYMPEGELRREIEAGVVFSGYYEGERLVGVMGIQDTWSAVTWAIRFYEKHGFRLLSPEEAARVLRKYWSIPDRQVETSVVLADDRWR